MKERLAGPDYRFLTVCLTLLAATTWYSTRNFYRAFPEASLDFKVGRDEGRARAAAFLNERNLRVEGYRQAASFTFDETAKTFLEREVGLEAANRIMGTRVRLWRWSYRWFKPLQKEEFRVDITPRGEVAGFDHEIPEDAARATADPAAARQLAEDFLRRQIGRDQSTLEFVDSSEAARPHRTDRVFTWRERDFDLNGGTNRVEVTILGDEIGGYREFLKVPEQWNRDYHRLRSKNNAASTVDSAVTLALLGGMLAVIAMRVRRQEIRWRVCGAVAAIGMLLTFLSQLNQLPLEEFEYRTTDSYTSFMALQLLQAVIAALGAGGMLFVFTAGAEPLYRESFGKQMSLGRFAGMRSLRTKRFFLGSVLGITLTGVFVAYQTAFYIAAYRWGAWSPADVPYSDLLNTRFPWLYVLLGGFLPAVSEEFLFRMFAIPFLRKLVRSTVAALVLAGFLWGFGHASYPQQPFYIRGVEVGIGGVALGLIMLRWGILPTLVWHYSVDAMYTAMLLLRSDSVYLRASGAASAGVVVLPVVAALAAYLRKGGFEPADGLLNADEPKPEKLPEAAEVGETAMPAEDTALPRWTVVAAIGLFAAGVVALRLPVEEFGQSPKYAIGQSEALAASDTFLRTQGLDPATFRHVTFPETHWNQADQLAGKYFLERMPASPASALFERYRPIAHWVTRYFRPLDKEEVLVAIHPESARVTGYHHTLPDDLAGADLPREEAVRIAAQFATRIGLDTTGLELKEAESEKQKARRDHRLVWEARPTDSRNVEETRFRVKVSVDGDRPVSARVEWKVPESYIRGRSRENFLSIVVTVFKFGVMAGALVMALWITIQSIRDGVVRWGVVLKIAVPVAVAGTLPSLLSMPILLRGYPTAVPLATFQAMSYVNVLIEFFTTLLMLTGAAALLGSRFPAGLVIWRTSYRAKLGKGAAIALIAAAGMMLLMERGAAFLQSRFHGQSIFSFSSPELIAGGAPSVATIAGACRSSLLLAAMLGAAALAAKRLPRWARVPLGMLAACVMLPLGVRTPGEFALHYAIGLAAVAAVVVFCRWFGRSNFLAYALAIWLISLSEPMAELFGTRIAATRMHGWIVAAVLAASIVWAIAPAMRRSSRMM